MGSDRGVEERNLKQEPMWQVFEILLTLLKYWVSCVGLCSQLFPLGFQSR